MMKTQVNLNEMYKNFIKTKRDNIKNYFLITGENH